MLRGIEFWLYLAVTRMAGGRLIQRLRSKSEQAGITSKQFQERLGVTPKSRNRGQLIWLHTRDTASALPLFEVIEQLNEQDLGLSFLVTTRRMENVGELLDHMPNNTQHQFFPIDLDVPIRNFLNHWVPDVVVISEGEFWPRLLITLAKQKVPLIALNTKMSDKKFHRWLWLPSLAKPVLNTFDLILAQDNQVSDKLKRLGVKSGIIRVTGAMAGTKKLLGYDDALYMSLSSTIGNRSVWLAAVTNRDEEDVVVNAHKAALRRNRRLLLILHTREEKRGVRISARHENKNLSFALQENGEIPDETTDVYVSDQSVELATYMRLAMTTFCGGTLSDGKTIDPFHPASMGSAIIHGPEKGDHADGFMRYSDAGAARLVLNGGQLAKALNEILGPSISAEMALSAWEISSEGGEVSSIVISEILEKLAEGRPKNATA